MHRRMPGNVFTKFSGFSHDNQLSDKEEVCPTKMRMMKNLFRISVVLEYNLPDDDADDDDEEMFHIAAPTHLCGTIS